MFAAPTLHVPASRMLLALLLGLTAAAANILGGLFILHREWSRQYLKYFLALGAGFMLAAALLEILPEAVALSGSVAYFLVLVGYFIVHFFEHTLAPFSFWGRNARRAFCAQPCRSFRAAGSFDSHVFRWRGHCIRVPGFRLAGWRNFSGHRFAQNSRRFYSGAADDCQRAEPPHCILGGDLAGRCNRGGHSADGLAAFAGGLCAADFGGSHVVCRRD